MVDPRLCVTAEGTSVMHYLARYNPANYQFGLLEKPAPKFHSTSSIFPKQPKKTAKDHPPHLLTGSNSPHPHASEGLSSPASPLDEILSAPASCASHHALFDLIRRVFRYFLARGCLINTPNLDGITPLHDAAFRGCPEMVRLLLDLRHPLNPLTKRGDTPLIYASRGDRLDSALILLKAGAEALPKGQDGDCLDVACSYGMRRLLEPFHASQVAQKREQIVYARFFHELPQDVVAQIHKLGISSEQAARHFKATLHILRQVRGIRVLMFPPLSEMGLVRKEDVFKHYRLIEQSARGGFGSIFVAKKRSNVNTTSSTSSSPPLSLASAPSPATPLNPSQAVLDPQNVQQFNAPPISSTATANHATSASVIPSPISVSIPSRSISVPAMPSSLSSTSTSTSTSKLQNNNNINTINIINNLSSSSSSLSSSSSSSSPSTSSRASIRYAIKEIKCKTQKDVKRALREVTILARLHHPNIVCFEEAYFLHNQFWVVQEYLHGGSLKTVLDSAVLQERFIAHVALCLLRALSYLHSSGLVHRDVKPSNIMLTLSGEVKLIDFGLCLDVSMGPVIHRAGTCWYMAPEVILAHQHAYPADIWSAGITIYEMCGSGPPFSQFGEAQSLFRTATGEIPRLKNPSQFSPLLSDLLERCFKFDPDDRAEAFRLIEHPWITSNQCSPAYIEEIVARIFLASAISSVMSGPRIHS